jgi:hypothetical protein
MATYEGLTAEQIATVLLVKLGPKYMIGGSPSLQKVAKDTVFKVLIATGRAPRRHYMYFVSKVSDKDMDNWLEHAIHRIKAYAME